MAGTCEIFHKPSSLGYQRDRHSLDEPVTLTTFPRCNVLGELFIPFRKSVLEPNARRQYPDSSSFSYHITSLRTISFFEPLSVRLYCTNGAVLQTDQKSWDRITGSTRFGTSIRLHPVIPPNALF